MTPRPAPLAGARLAVTIAVAQLRHAAGLLSRAGALRAALRPAAASTQEDAITSTPRKPIRCRVLHLHRWQQCWTSDGEPYRACARCGELHPRTRAMVGSTIPWTPST